MQCLEDELWLLSSRVAICSWGAFTAGDRKVGSDYHPERTPIAREVSSHLQVGVEFEFLEGR